MLDRLWLAAYDLSRVNNYKQIELKMKSPRFSPHLPRSLCFSLERQPPSTLKPPPRL